MRELPEMQVPCVGAQLTHVAGFVRVSWDDGGSLELPLDWCEDVDAQAVPDGSETQIVLAFTPRSTSAGTASGRVSIRLEAAPESAADAHEFAALLGRRPAPAEHPTERLPTRVPPSDPDWIGFPAAPESEELYDFVLRRMAAEYRE